MSYEITNIHDVMLCGKVRDECERENNDCARSAQDWEELG